MSLSLLLFSNTRSSQHRELLAHGRAALTAALDGRDEIVFVPFARADWSDYVAAISDALTPMGVRVRGITELDGAAEVIAAANAVFVGGGNTFRLLNRLQRHGLIEALQHVVSGGALYIGSSAGTNVAGPTIGTTNDMPIVCPPSFTSLGFVPFQINPHYIDPLPGGSSTSETRAERLAEYLEENDRPVVALREDTWLRRRGAHLIIEGAAGGGRLFRRGTDAQDVVPGADLSDLLTVPER